MGLLKKAASGVLASFPCSRTGSALCAKKNKGNDLRGTCQAIRGLPFGISQDGTGRTLRQAQGMLF